jgi:hypothetical protein
MDPDDLDMEFDGEIWHWRGPAPFHFITVPEAPSAAIRAISAEVTYGWGMIPVRVRIGETHWETALFPKDGRYVVPIKDVVRAAEHLADGDVVTIQLAVRH